MLELYDTPFQRDTVYMRAELLSLVYTWYYQTFIQVLKVQIPLLILGISLYIAVQNVNVYL